MDWREWLLEFTPFSGKIIKKILQQYKNKEIKKRDRFERVLDYMWVGDDQNRLFLAVVENFDYAENHDDQILFDVISKCIDLQILVSKSGNIVFHIFSYKLNSFQYHIKRCPINVILSVINVLDEL